jgi:hypothetical protein
MKKQTTCSTHGALASIEITDECLLSKKGFVGFIQTFHDNAAKCHATNMPCAGAVTLETVP